MTINLNLLLRIYFISIYRILVHLKIKIFINPFCVPLAHQLIKEQSVVDQSPTDDTKETNELNRVNTPLQ